jgi:transcriptional regulator GlxA family with amidase domain
MPIQILPRDLKRALDLFEADPSRAWRVGELATACGVAPRTLQSAFVDLLAARRSSFCVTNVSHWRERSYWLRQ